MEYLHFQKFVLFNIYMKNNWNQPEIMGSTKILDLVKKIDEGRRRREGWGGGGGRGGGQEFGEQF